MKWQEIIDRFNQGDDSFVESIFGDLNTFFEIAIVKKNLGDLFDLDSDESSSWLNRYLLFIYKKDRNKFIEFVSDFFPDIIFENGKFYYKVYELSDLAEFFCHERRGTNSRDVASKVLGEDFYEFFDVYDKDIIRNVLDEIDQENLALLVKKIFVELKDTKIPTETEFLEQIGYEQGHVDYAYLKEEDIKDILKNQQTIEFLLSMDELTDLESDLKNLYSTSFNNAYNDELYDEVWGELSEFFIGKGDWIKVPNSKNRFFLQIELRDFIGDILDYLEENIKYPDMALLHNRGMDFYDILNAKECLTLNVPNYPSFSNITKYVNENFSDVL